MKYQDYSDEDTNSSMVEESALAYGHKAQTLEHLRYQGVESIMQIDDVPMLRVIVSQMANILDRTSGNKSSRNKERILSTLNNISALTDDWDDEGAIAILPEVIDATKTFISAAPDPILDNWSLFPSVNGTVKLETRQATVHAGINIGKEEFTYFVRIGQNETYGKSALSTKRLLDIITQVYYE